MDIVNDLILQYGTEKLVTVVLGCKKNRYFVKWIPVEQNLAYFNKPVLGFTVELRIKPGYFEKNTLSDLTEMYIYPYILLFSFISL